MEKLVKFLKDEEGAIAMEYALIAAFVALMIFAGVRLLGNNLSTFFNSVGTNVGGWAVP
jgi:pilus assembly protein Flp/PilA